MLLFGALFALFSSTQRQVSLPKDPYFWHGLVFSSLFNIAVIYAVIYYPDWMWMYFLTNSKNSLSELIYLFVFLYYMPYVLGFYLGRDLKQKSILWALSFIFLMAAVEVWLVTHLFDRYAVIGTNDQFFSGTGTSLFSPENPIGPVMNGSVGVMIVYFIVVAIFYFKGKKNRAT